MTNISSRNLLPALLLMAMPVLLMSTNCTAQALSSSKAVTAREAAARKQAAAKPRKKARSPSRSAQAIVVLVNDQPITRYDLQQRTNLMALRTNIGKTAQARFKQLASSARAQKRLREIQKEVITSNRGKTRDQLIAIFRKRQKAYGASLQRQAVKGARAGLIKKLKRKALDQLVNERLQIQAAKKRNSLASDAEIEKVIKKLASNNKMTLAQFAAQLKSGGSNISSMKAQFKAQYSWRRLISRKFGALVSITNAQVDNVIKASAASAGKTSVELQLQRITLTLPANNDQRLLARRFSEAERMRGRFKDCNSMAGLVKGVADAKFAKLGMSKPSSFPEPARTMLLSAKVGQMTPPLLEQTGIEFYAVCGRRAGKGDQKVRAKAQASLRRKEFEVLAKRHLRDLRTDAHICRRQEASYLNHLTPCQRL